MSRSYKPRDPEITSRIMAKVPRSNTKVEVALRRELYHRGLRYRVDYSGAAGRPDIAFLGPQVAVFVDGDFWHGRVLQEQGLEGFNKAFKTPRKQYWLQKLKRNIARDQQVDKALRSEGWRVIRFWESDIKDSLNHAADKIEQVVRHECT